MGHFLNDLTAACWFNFLLIYLTHINPIDLENPGFYAGFKIYLKTCYFMWLNSRWLSYTFSRIFL